MWSLLINWLIDLYDLWLKVSGNDSHYEVNCLRFSSSKRNECSASLLKTYMAW